MNSKTLKMKAFDAVAKVLCNYNWMNKNTWYRWCSMNVEVSVLPFQYNCRCNGKPISGANSVKIPTKKFIYYCLLVGVHNINTANRNTSYIFHKRLCLHRNRRSRSKHPFLLLLLIRQKIRPTVNWLSLLFWKSKIKFPFALRLFLMHFMRFTNI